MINVKFKGNAINGEVIYFYDNERNYCTNTFNLDVVNIHVKELEHISVFNESVLYNPLLNPLIEHTCVILAVGKQDLTVYAYSFQLGTIISVPIACIIDIRLDNESKLKRKHDVSLLEGLKESFNKLLEEAGTFENRFIDHEKIGIYATEVQNKVLITNEVFRTVTPYWLFESIEEIYSYRYGNPFLQPVSKVCPEIQVEFEEDNSLRFKYAARFPVNLDSEFEIRNSIEKFAEIKDGFTSISDVSIHPSKREELERYIISLNDIDLLGELAIVENTLRTISRIVTHRTDSYCFAEALPLQLHYSQWNNELFYRLELHFNFGKNAHIGDFEDLLKQAFNDFFNIFKDSLNEVTEEALPF
ncbi:hypothetical protein [Solibacillus sp. NPDC093137]|uniref:hypothetical protein n=1 Tax=Solibacillus sp. NPDC093137 TaxID=3390678 RepID=UPI003D00EBB9